MLELSRLIRESQERGGHGEERGRLEPGKYLLNREILKALPAGPLLDVLCMCDRYRPRLQCSRHKSVVAYCYLEAGPIQEKKKKCDHLKNGGHWETCPFRYLELGWPTSRDCKAARMAYVNLPNRWINQFHGYTMDEVMFAAREVKGNLTDAHRMALAVVLIKWDYSDAGTWKMIRFFGAFWNHPGGIGERHG